MGDVRVERALPIQSLHECPSLLIGTDRASCNAFGTVIEDT